MIVREVSIRVIPHNEHRYETVGDWIFNSDNSKLFIYVSDMGNWKYHNLVARHEYDEALLCIDRGICEKKVSAFDLWYEGRRLTGDPACQGEPGDHPQAPYRKEHFFATITDRMLAAELNVNWEDYDAAIQAL